MLRLEKGNCHFFLNNYAISGSAAGGWSYTEHSAILKYTTSE